MTLLIWIVRLLVILMVVRFIVNMVANARRAAQMPPRSKGRPQERIGGTLVRDPNCGTFIPQEKAIVTGSGDARQFFCSTTCRDAWNAKAS
jgi:hypothetical protein